MTVVLREVRCQAQTVTYQPPIFKARALFAYGHAQSVYGQSFGSGQSSYAQWGGYSLDQLQGVFGGANFGITNVGSLETGAGGHAGPGTTFYGQGGGTFTGQLRDPSFGCGSLAMLASLATVDYAGLMIFGGRTLQTAVGDLTFAGTGNTVVTGLPFQPQLLLIGGTGKTTRGGHAASSGGFQNSFGAADAHGNQFAVAGGSIWNVSTGNRRVRTINNGCVLQVQPGNTVGSLVSFDPTGFTINISAYNGPEFFWWMVFGDTGGDFSVGTFTAGAASITPGFTPDSLFFAGAGNTVYGANEAGIGLAYGAASNPGLDPGAVARSGWMNAASANVLSSRYWRQGALSWIRHPTGGGFVSEAEADVSSWGSTCNLNWTKLTASVLKGGYVAFKTSKGPGWSGCGGTFLPQIYRRW